MADMFNRLGGLSMPRKSVVRLTDRPDMTLTVYRGRRTTIQYNTIHSEQNRSATQNITSAYKKRVSKCCRIVTVYIDLNLIQP